MARPRARSAKAGGSSRFTIKGRKWPIVVIICLAVVGILLFIAQDPRTLHVRSALGASDQAFPEYVATLINVPVTRGDVIEVLQNGDEFYPPMLDAIRSAKDRIQLETYNYNKGEAGETFTVALADAARRGVNVQLVLDSFGASAPPPDLDARIEGAGGKVLWFNQFRPRSIESTNTRTHRKLLVVDGQVAFTGGAGVADHWLGHAQDDKHWRDTHFRVTGPAVRLLEACFYENWLEAGGEGAPEIPAENGGSPGATQTLVVWSNPIGGVSNVKQLYLYSIAAARRSIDILSPYFVPDASGRAALNEARSRGVRVRVLSDGDVTDAKSVKHASRRTYQRMLDAGIEVYEYQPTMMHAKVMIIDGVWSVFGSGNFDNRSLELNDEITMAVFDPELGRKLSSAFEADIRSSKRWTTDTWKARPWHWKVREWFWGIFGEVF
jgi:cardiolipin synthase